MYVGCQRRCLCRPRSLPGPPPWAGVSSLGGLGALGRKAQLPGCSRNGARSCSLPGEEPALPLARCPPSRARAPAALVRSARGAPRL